MTAAKSMKVNAPTRTGLIWPILQGLPPAAFYLLFYLYLAFAVDLRLLYNGGGLIDNFPTFYVDGEFLKGQLAYPAGMIEYVSAFLAQLFYYSWAGAAVVTCQGWLIGLGTDAYLQEIGAPRLRILRFVGPLVLLAVYSQYVFHFTMTLAFTVAVVAACLFLRFAPAGCGPSRSLLSGPVPRSLRRHGSRLPSLRLPVRRGPDRQRSSVPRRPVVWVVGGRRSLPRRCHGLGTSGPRGLCRAAADLPGQERE